MCIRDRDKIMERKKKQSFYFKIFRKIHPEKRTCISSTVSYTHLRAHETALHLVCRLRLEKSLPCVALAVTVGGGWGWGAVFFQAEDGIRDVERSRGLGDVYKRQATCHVLPLHQASTETSIQAR